MSPDLTNYVVHSSEEGVITVEELLNSLEISTDGNLGENKIAIKDAVSLVENLTTKASFEHFENQIGEILDELKTFSREFAKYKKIFVEDRIKFRHSILDIMILLRNTGFQRKDYFFLLSGENLLNIVKETIPAIENDIRLYELNEPSSPSLPSLREESARVKNWQVLIEVVMQAGHLDSLDSRDYAVFAELLNLEVKSRDIYEILEARQNIKNPSKNFDKALLALMEGNLWYLGLPVIFFPIDLNLDANLVDSFLNKLMETNPLHLLKDLNKKIEQIEKNPKFSEDEILISDYSYYWELRRRLSVKLPGEN